MQTINTAFEQQLTALIEAQIDKLKNDISGGNVKSFDDYRFLAGRIAGLGMAMDHFEEVNKKLDER